MEIFCDFNAFNNDVFIGKNDYSRPLSWHVSETGGRYLWIGKWEVVISKSNEFDPIRPSVVRGAICFGLGCISALLVSPYLSF